MASKASASKAKAATAKSTGKAEKRHYNYVELGKAALTTGEAQHFYAVVVDATFPYKTNKERYICSMKVIDQSTKDYINLVLYAKRFEDLPIIHRLGDVIRIHRA